MVTVYLAVGTVYNGAGAVWQRLTCGIPVLNPKFQAAFTAEVDLIDFEFFTVLTEQSHHYNLSPTSSPLILTPSTSSEPLISIPSNTMATNIPMPACKDHTTLKFDPMYPQGLHHYFSNLDIIFGHAGVTDNTEMKQHAIQYINVNTRKLLEALPEYHNNMKTCTDFTKAIYALYTGSEEHKQLVADMDKLVGERQLVLPQL
jgi:hypothetical protein